MASRGLKLIQNGVVTYAPNTSIVRSAAEGYNYRTRKSARAEKEHITILEATEEEVEKYLYPKPAPRKAATTAVPQSVAETSEIRELREQNIRLQAQMETLMGMMTGHVTTVPAPAGPAKTIPVEEVAPEEVPEVDDDEDENEFQDFSEEAPKRRGRPKSK